MPSTTTRFSGPSDKSLKPTSWCRATHLSSENLSRSSRSITTGMFVVD